MTTFAKRRVGTTALEVTELGFGSATLGGMTEPISDELGRATAQAALDAGVRYFDTAPHYGFGRAEHIIGDVARFRTDPPVISTKVGRLLRPVPDETQRTAPSPWAQPYPFELRYDYSYDGVMRSFEDSLQRLGLGRVDILLVHDIGVQTHGPAQNAIYWQQLVEGGYRALNELRSRGVVAAIGLGVNEWQVLMDAVVLGDWDVFLLANRYNLIEQGCLDLLSTCAERRISVIAAGPFAGGVLAGASSWGPPTGQYQSPPSKVIERVTALAALAKLHEVPLEAAALQFAMAHPAICSVVTGPKSSSEVAATMRWWDICIPTSFWDDLARNKLVADRTPLPTGRAA